MDSIQTNALPTNQITPPIIYNYSSLPYHQLSWEELEKLCFEILCVTYGPECCHMYGSRGQNQHGFDCYVRNEDGSYMLFQVKKAISFKKKDLTDALEIWEKGEWYSKTKCFTIFSSNNLQDTSFVDQFELEKQRFAKLAINFEAMGSLRVDTILREQPGIVGLFFGPSWRDQFCTPLALRKYLGAFLPDDHEPKIYPAVQFYIPRKLTNPSQSEEIYKGHFQEQRILLSSYISNQLEDNKLARAIILADAATGKSKELENLATLYSSQKGSLFPILIRLKNFHDDIDSYIAAAYLRWKQVQPERLLLLIDGLDEVPANEFGSFIKKFNTFVQVNKNINIITTIRSNVYNSDVGADIDADDKLNVLYLNGLEKDDVNFYISERIPEEQKKRQLKRFLDRKWVNDLLGSPFYLSALTDLSLENETELPKNKAETIEKIIKYKIKKDDEKYGSETNHKQLLDFAKKLALFLTLTGKNSIEEEKFNDFGTLSVSALKRCSLFRLERPGLSHTITFEHNNFQEYLAAQSLSGLDWLTLEPILFHTTGVKILKPKMFNTVNFLFAILKSTDTVFKNLLKSILETEQELFLKFEKDKLSLQQRLSIFRNIIVKGKSLRIYYLAADFRINELCEFVGYSPEAMKFILDELSIAAEENHRYCLLDVIYLYNQLKLTQELKKRIQNQMETILATAGYSYSVYDRAIDILTIYQIFNPRLLKLIKSVPHNDHKMVRGAIIKYIDTGKFSSEFKYVIESDGVLTNKSYSIIAGLETYYMKYVLKNLNLKNALILLQHFKTVTKRLKDITGYESYSEQSRPINQIYQKLGEIHTQTGDKRLYQLYLDYLVAISYEDYKQKQWGDPSLFFSEYPDKPAIFWDFLKHKDLDKLDYFLFKFYDNSMGQQVIDQYKVNAITADHVRTIRLSLENPEHANLQQLLLENFGDQFKFQSVPNWDKINNEREARNLILLQDHQMFLEEGKKIYQLIKASKKQDTTEDIVFDFEFSEKREIQKKIKSTIVLRAITDYKVKGGYEAFKKAFDTKGWEWYVFQTVSVFLQSGKKELTTQLLDFAKKYLIETILPQANFTKAIKENKDGSYTVSNASSHLSNFFLHSDIVFESNIILEILKIDYYGFGNDHLRENTDKKLYQAVYNRSDKDEFKNHILSNLQNPDLADRVITTQAAACQQYNIVEGLPYILQKITEPKFSASYKEQLINIAISLSDGPEIFEDIIYSFTTITKDWQFKICKHLFDCGHEVDRLKTLVAKSNIQTRVKDVEIYWKFGFLKMATALGSKKALDYLFNTYFIKRTPTSFLNVKPDWFTVFAKTEPALLLKYCFKSFTVLAPAFKKGRGHDLPEMLDETIRLCAVTSQSLFGKAMNQYEQVIKDNVSKNPEITYLRWYERRLVNSYLTHTISYETEIQANDLIKKIIPPQPATISYV